MIKDLTVSAALIMGVVAWVTWDVDTCTRWETRWETDRNAQGERVTRPTAVCVERAK